ncbi:hypothetical protein SmJEL517_g01124 [Synchytrium microbalum]|uniref:SMP-30/Gluconolactonase/LRE-like region domain-containing protein n=1 Tax=Synchytrium microbalum TaxID=1806994 RepID=A0A507CHW1_9FUNG|nr:uncharacterized protein SmJEL517_g01124 [Synchytrium microbalum]TPX37203.1 hypothetical protein SmJEL517_g01124 [Synchytrium microbalum]
MQTETLQTGLAFGEGPRWHNGKLFFSDFYFNAVKTYDPVTKSVETVLTLASDKAPSGLGWLPDGRMLVVVMEDRKLIVVDHNGKTSDYADLSNIATFHTNDMVVSANGTAYVGNFGFDLVAAEHNIAAHYRTATLAIVHPDRRVEAGPSGLGFPNGTVITPDGKTLIIAESFAKKLSAFDIDPTTNRLSNHRVYAETPDCTPDGICLDAEGCVWVANATGLDLFRYGPGGKILGSVRTTQPSFACMLGGADRKTLFILTAPSSGPAQGRIKGGKIEAVKVTVPGAGLP